MFFFGPLALNMCVCTLRRSSSTNFVNLCVAIYFDYFACILILGLAGKGFLGVFADGQASRRRMEQTLKCFEAMQR